VSLLEAEQAAEHVLTLTTAPEIETYLEARFGHAVEEPVKGS